MYLDAHWYEMKIPSIVLSTVFFSEMFVQTRDSLELYLVLYLDVGIAK